MAPLASLQLSDIGGLAGLDSGARALALAQVLRAELVQHCDSFGAGRSSTALSVSLGDILNESVSIVRSLKNASAPIDQLPNEILSDIFALVPREAADTSDIASFRFFHTVDVRDAVPLTAVCRRWRQVAHATPSLWSTIYDSRSPRTARGRCLSARYTGGPISVFCDNIVSDSTVDLLQSHAERVRHFYAFGSPTLAALAKTNLPYLEHCIVRGVSSGVFAPRSPLFAGESVRLRSLVLHGVCFLPSASLPSLTHLMISKPARLASGATYSVGDLLDFLAGSPLLRELHLYRLAGSGVEMARGEVEVPEGRQCVRLDRLERLCVSEAQDEREGEPLGLQVVPFLDALVQRIRIDDSCTVELGELQPSELGRCLGLLGPLRRATRLCVEHSEVWVGHGTRRHRRSLILADAETAHCARVDVALPTHEYEDGFLLHFLDSLRQPIFQDVQELYVDGRSAFGWPEDVFDALPRVEVLVVRLGRGTSLAPAPCAKDVVGALGASSTPSSKGLSGVVHCPRLTTLVCGAQSNEDETYLLRLAAERARAGCPLRRLLVGREAGDGPLACTCGGVREYDGEGGLVRTYDGESEEAAVWRASRLSELVAPPSCRDWMGARMSHPAVLF
ncbi:hypothetical protein BD311DRAFT_784411 [Dichomitus squalens]|uniref:F-box domain-containing protein n=1 Tax=Dichomitus squalens TaxID=114155 RepID=A0A4Q9N593_9APHY|nr:hypothetical protein BD311DRAFT_784411 [Dichomitus squalens]